MTGRIWKNLELKMVLLLLLIVALLTVSLYFVIRNQYHNLVIDKLKEDATGIYHYAEQIIAPETFFELNTREDEQKDLFRETQTELNEIRRIANILYLYTAKRNDSGEYIYVVDGLIEDEMDEGQYYSHVGDLIEEEIVPYLMRSLNDEIVFGDDMMETEWGVVYVVYFPFHEYHDSSGSGNVIGAIGMEFDCEHLYNSSNRISTVTIIVSFVISSVFVALAYYIVRKVVKGTESAFSDLEKEKAEYTNRLQLLNRMSETLLQSTPDDFEISLRWCANTLAGAMNLNRVTIWKNYTKDKELYCVRLFEWADRNYFHAETAEDEVRLHYDTTVPKWRETLLKGKCINSLVREMPKEMQEHYKQRSIVSLFTVPIFLQDSFWGFAGFDDCKNERRFSEKEETVLRSASQLVAGMLSRNEEAEKAGKAEELTRLMLDATPLGCQIIDKDFEIIDCNEAIVKLYGYKNKYDLLKKWRKECNPEYQPDGCLSSELMIILLARAYDEGHCVFEWMHQLPDGTPLPAEITLTRVEYEDDYIIAAYTRDLRSEKSLEEKARKIYYDALTGIYNRRYLDERLDQLIRSLSRSGGMLSVMMIDIDHFKRYNDTYGHSEGDKCLRIVTEILSKCVTRADDFVARYGGEEFAVVMPATDGSGACIVAEKMLGSMRDLRIPHENSSVCDYVTFSIGVASGKASHKQDGSEYVKLADELLYKSKQDGRDRYSFASL